MVSRLLLSFNSPAGGADQGPRPPAAEGESSHKALVGDTHLNKLIECHRAPHPHGGMGGARTVGVVGDRTRWAPFISCPCSVDSAMVIRPA